MKKISQIDGIYRARRAGGRRLRRAVLAAGGSDGSAILEPRGRRRAARITGEGSCDAAE